MNSVKITDVEYINFIKRYTYFNTGYLKFDVDIVPFYEHIMNSSVRGDSYLCRFRFNLFKAYEAKTD